MELYSFEKLGVWQKSRKFSLDMYALTSEFPGEEKFGLISQLRRAAISVSSNIAEGSTRWSRKDQARFYEIAYGSLIEILNQLIICCDLKYIDDSELTEKRTQINEIARMLHSLYRSSKEY